MFKKLLTGLFYLISFNAFSGEVFVPKFTHTSTGSWCTTVSNVSNINVDVTVSAYISTGALYTGSSVNNGIPSQFNTPFKLQPNQTTLLCAKNVPGSSQHGYAKIKSEPTDPQAIGHNSFVIASAYWVSGNFLMNIPVNSGNPF
ncbi:hypothetical protein [Agarilytica rhodophyticola]|uniref:hypothetical protein n=1 Tax=Agarilytica rhodophyticola TaxID=1737490 RepID=UPI000B346F12|nr:hypothetical protein [Agarilytica rhodophyticola]